MADTNRNTDKDSQTDTHAWNTPTFIAHTDTNTSKASQAERQTHTWHAQTETPIKTAKQASKQAGRQMDRHTHTQITCRNKTTHNS